MSSSYTPFLALLNPFTVSIKSPSYLQAMAAKFAPLVLPLQLHDLPNDYGQHVKKFNGGDEVTAQHHLVWFDDYCDIENMDHEDIKMRLFALNFSGDVKQWFRSLPNHSIITFQECETLFLRKWERKRNTLQLIT